MFRIARDLGYEPIESGWIDDLAKEMLRNNGQEVNERTVKDYRELLIASNLADGIWIKEVHDRIWLRLDLMTALQEYKE